MYFIQKGGSRFTDIDIPIIFYNFQMDINTTSFKSFRIIKY